jgi:hypothetical protein
MSCGTRRLRVSRPEDRFAVTQYVHPCKPGLVRIVKHGHRWRSLVNEQEVGRHESVDTALQALRSRWPQARIPHSLHLWRHLPEPRCIGHARTRREGAEAQADSRARA